MVVWEVLVVEVLEVGRGWLGRSEAGAGTDTDQHHQVEQLVPAPGTEKGHLLQEQPLGQPDPGHLAGRVEMEPLAV